MIDKKYIEHWNLRDYNKSIHDISISCESDEMIASIIDNFPNVDYKIGMLVGNLIDGNTLFNYLIEELMNGKKIESQCLRIGLESLFDRFYYHPDRIDLILLDQIDCLLMTDVQKLSLTSKIDSLWNRSDLIFLNISKKEELDALPNGLIDLIGNSPYNIEILKNDI